MKLLKNRIFRHLKRCNIIPGHFGLINFALNLLWQLFHHWVNVITRKIRLVVFKLLLLVHNFLYLKLPKLLQFLIILLFEKLAIRHPFSNIDHISDGFLKTFSLGVWWQIAHDVGIEHKNHLLAPLYHLERCSEWVLDGGLQDVPEHQPTVVVHIVQT